MLPLKRFTEILSSYKDEFNQQFDELILASKLLSKRSNFIEREDNGTYIVQAVGRLNEIIPNLEDMLERLKKYHKAE